jgi:hypothetical protein
MTFTLLISSSVDEINTFYEEMNSTTFIEPSMKNSSTIITESWFIPLDIIIIVCIIIGIILPLIYLGFIIFDKTCQTVPMILVANTCVAELFCAGDILGMALFTLTNDLKQIEFEDRFCSLRSYLKYASLAIFNYSFLIQAFYRYVTVVYPARLFWASRRNQFVIICLTWIFGLIFPIPAILADKSVYNVHNQICQVPLRFHFSIIYLAHCVYLIPNSLIIYIYLKLVQYVHEMSKHVAPANTLSRAQRELQIVGRIVIVITILIVLGIPYTVFLVMSFFTVIHKYHFRIAFVFIHGS